MLYYPNCRDEFRVGAEICQDCNVALVEGLSTLPEKELEERLAYITTVSYEPEAEMMSGILAENSILYLKKGRSLGVTGYISPSQIPMKSSYWLLRRRRLGQW